jgi:hypothetical protein
MSYFVTAAVIISAATTAYSYQQQSKTNKAIAKNNAVMNEYAAQDAERRGEKDAQEVQRKAAALRGRQRSLMAARGLDLNVGTAADIVDETDFFAREDVATARTNAAKEAWRYRVAGQQGMSVASAESQQANLKSFSTLLGAAGSVEDRWYQRNRGG